MEAAETHSSFAEALRPHYADAVRYCRALCARESPDDAEDVLQQALLLALRGYRGLRDEARFRSWLFRIITREFRAGRRRAFWRRFVPMHADIERLPAVLTHRLESTTERHLLAALATLGERERIALLLFEVAGLSLEEVRDIQGDESISAVKSRLSRARARTRELLLTGGYTPTSIIPSGIEAAAIDALDNSDRGLQ